MVNKKRLAIVNPNFPPEVMPSGVMCRSLAVEFIKRGYDVTVITSFPNRPGGKIFDNYKRYLRKVTQEKEGFRLIRIWTWFIGSDRTIVNRLLENISFGISSFINLFLEKKFDIVINNPWPVFSAYLISSAANLRHSPSFYYCEDIWPEQIENAGKIKSGGLIYQLLYWLDYKAFKRSIGVFALSHSFAEYIATSRKISTENILIAPIHVDTEAVYPVPRNNSWRQRHGISEDTFVVLFSGTMGYVSGLNILKDVLPLISQESKILFLCIGEGPLKPEIEKLTYQYSNIRCLPYQSEDDFLWALGTADLTLLTMDPQCGIGSVPSKMYTYMAAGRPIISNVPANTENARLITVSGCGQLVQPGDGVALAEGIISLRNKPELLKYMGTIGRKYIVENHTVQRIVDTMENFWAKILPEVKVNE